MIITERLPRKIQETHLLLVDKLGKSRYERRQEMKDKRIKVHNHQGEKVHKSTGGKVVLKKQSGDKIIKSDHYGGKFI